MVLLDVLGQRWMLRILWELGAQHATFRELRARCDDVSPTVLNSRLKELRDLDIIAQGEDGYGLTPIGRKLAEQLLSLDSWAKEWALAVSPVPSGKV